jgi:HK97 gp10 family phage protein
MPNSVKIVGLSQTVSNMKTLRGLMNGKSRSSPLLPALRAAGRVVQKDAKDFAPRDTGNLIENIVVRRVRPSKLGAATEGVEVTVRNSKRAYVASRRNDRAGRTGEEYKDYGALFYGRFSEFGTSHEPARPWLRPAFEQNKAALPDIIRSSLAASIEQAIARLKK